MNLVNNTFSSSSFFKKDKEKLQTPNYIIKILIERFSFKSKIIWNPMCGNGALIVNPLVNAGYDVFKTDTVDYKLKLDMKLDYFKCGKMPSRTDLSDDETDNFAVIANPPYKLANQFLLHTLSAIEPRTCSVLLPVKYLESTKYYNEIYSKFKPSKVLISVRKFGDDVKNSIDTEFVRKHNIKNIASYMWLCFDRDSWSKQDAKTEIEWIQ